MLPTDGPTIEIDFSILKQIEKQMIISIKKNNLIFDKLESIIIEENVYYFAYFKSNNIINLGVSISYRNSIYYMRVCNEQLYDGDITQTIFLCFSENEISSLYKYILDPVICRRNLLIDEILED